jgi:hypothetical protein
VSKARKALMSVAFLASALLAGCTSGHSGSTEATTVAANPASFVGSWHVHDGQLTIDENQTAQEVNVGGCTTPCTEHEALTWALSDNGQRLTAVVRGVTFTSRTDGTQMSGPGSPDQAEAGDSFYLTFVAPYLLKSTLIHMPVAQGGNPYWCGADLAASLQSNCGA